MSKLYIPGKGWGSQNNSTPAAQSMKLLYEGTTTGSAQTTHSCTGLTLVGYKHLLVEAKIQVAANNYFSILFGSDASDASNYYSNLVQNSGVNYNSAGSRLVNVLISDGFIVTSGIVTQSLNAGDATDCRLFQGKTFAYQTGVNGLAAEASISRDLVTKDADLTTIKFYCQSANGIGVGSTFAVWGVK